MIKIIPGEVFLISPGKLSINDVFPQSRREPKTRLELVTYSLRMLTHKTLYSASSYTLTTNIFYCSDKPIDKHVCLLSYVMLLILFKKQFYLHNLYEIHHTLVKKGSKHEA